MTKYRRYVLAIESLESRRLLAFTANSQLMLEHINRARADPAAEVARNPDVTSLNQDLAAGTISESSKQPLVPNSLIQTAAEMHSLDMFQNNFFSHAGSNGSASDARIGATGYSASRTGENIAFGYDTSKTTEALVVDSHMGLFASAGHRTNIMQEHYQEIGIATSIFSGPWNNGGGVSVPTGIDLLLATQNFATPQAAQTWVTGVVIDDADNDNFYDIGEGLGNVTIVASQGGVEQARTTSTSTGGYALALPSGQYDIVATGNGVTRSANVSIDNENVKVDFESGVDEVIAVSPVVAAIAAQDSIAGQRLELTISFTDDNLPVDSHSATIDWGDGTTTPIASATSPFTASHTFNSEGTFNGTVIVTDSTNRTGQQSFTTTVGPAVTAPVISDITAQPVTFGSTSHIEIAVTSEDRDISIVIEYGDGNRETLTSPNLTGGLGFVVQHAYSSPGSFPLSATVSSPHGSSPVTEQEVRVLPSVSWHNAAFPTDVDGRNETTPLDALIIINELSNRKYTDTQFGGIHSTASPAPANLDVNNDGYITPINALTVINVLNNSTTKSIELSIVSSSVSINLPTMWNALIDDDEEDDEER